MSTTLVALLYVPHELVGYFFVLYEIFPGAAVLATSIQQVARSGVSALIGVDTTTMQARQMYNAHISSIPPAAQSRILLIFYEDLLVRCYYIIIIPHASPLFPPPAQNSVKK